MNRFFRYLIIYISGIVVGLFISVTPPEFKLVTAGFGMVVFGILYMGMRNM